MQKPPIKRSQNQLRRDLRQKNNKNCNSFDAFVSLDDEDPVSLLAFALYAQKHAKKGPDRRCLYDSPTDMEVEAFRARAEDVVKRTASELKKQFNLQQAEEVYKIAREQVFNSINSSIDSLSSEVKNIDLKLSKEIKQSSGNIINKIEDSGKWNSAIGHKVIIAIIGGLAFALFFRCVPWLWEKVEYADPFKGMPSKIHAK